jgi:hypothetical protein
VRACCVQQKMSGLLKFFHIKKKEKKKAEDASVQKTLPGDKARGDAVFVLGRCRSSARWRFVLEEWKELLRKFADRAHSPLGRSPSAGGGECCFHSAPASS